MNYTGRLTSVALIAWSTSALGETPNDPYCGVWEYTETPVHTTLSMQHYLKIQKEKPGIYAFTEGYKWDNPATHKDEIVWNDKVMMENTDEVIHLKQTGDELRAKINARNFRATHAMLIAYVIVINSAHNDTFIYSVTADYGSRKDNEKHQATRIGNCTN